jgi:hypothetical protein
MPKNCHLEVLSPRPGETIQAVPYTDGDKTYYFIAITGRARHLDKDHLYGYLISHKDGSILPAHSAVNGSLLTLTIAKIKQTDDKVNYTLVVTEKVMAQTVNVQHPLVAIAITFTISLEAAKAMKEKPYDPTILSPVSPATVCPQFIVSGTYGANPVANLKGSMVNGGTSIEEGPATAVPDTNTGWTIAFTNVPEEAGYVLKVWDAVDNVAAHSASKDNITVDSSVCNPPPLGGPGATGGSPPGG